MDKNPQIEGIIEDMAANEGVFALAYAVLRLVETQESIAYQLKQLGNGDASTTMGAIEGLAVKIHEGLDKVSLSILDISSSIDPSPMDQVSTELKGIGQEIGNAGARLAEAIGSRE